MATTVDRATPDANTPNEILDLLGGEAGDTHACEAIERWAKAGRADDLAVLARLLEAESEKGADADRLESIELVADHVEDQLALSSGDGAVDAVFALSLQKRERSVVVPRSRALRLRAFASRLGYGHGPGAFFGALARFGKQGEHLELLACWLHELVLRGTSLEGGPHRDAVASFHGDLVSVGHPLAALPLSLLASEREAPSYMPLYGDNGLGTAIDALASGTMSTRSIPPPAGGAAVGVERIADASLEGRLSAAVLPWAEGKSGKVEAKAFALSAKVEGNGIGGWLVRALALDSTTSAQKLDISRTGAEGVFGPLFSAASNGGAYSSGVGGAYGRLAAWTSLGALVGAPASASIPEIEKLAARTTFLTFRAAGPWFYDVAWDLGALALRPDGLSVAVLAATDTE